MGVILGNKKGGTKKTDYHEIKKVESSKYAGKTVVRNGKSRRKYKNNNKGRKILSAVDVHYTWIIQKAVLTGNLQRPVTFDYSIYWQHYFGPV